MKFTRIVFIWIGFFFLLEGTAVAHPGWGLVMDSRGQIYFADVNRNIIWKIDTSGGVHAFINGKHSHALSIDKADNLYGEHVEYDARNDRWLSHLWMATPDGTVLDVPPDRAAILRLVDKEGNSYHFSSDAHKRTALIFRVDPKGDTTLIIGGTWGDRDGKGRQARLRTFGPGIFGPGGALYFGSGGLLRKLAPDGTVTTLIGPREGFGDPDVPRASGFLGVASDAHGNLYAAHWERKVIMKVTTSGEVIVVHRSGPLWSPSGVMMKDDDLYILEHRAGVTTILEKGGFGGPRIKRLSVDGRVIIIGTAP